MLLRRILAAVAVLIAGVLIFAATKPNVFRVERSIEIAAPAEKIFPLIDDFHNWSKWAPQDKEDPTMQRIYSGPASGEGAISEWKSSGSAGRGRMMIVESVPSSKISIEVAFEKPFRAHNVNRFILEPAGSATKVTWTMRGRNLYVMKLMSVFTNMDRMAGKHFEDGLANLKTAAEQ
jgi:uncharacterized protein YndB with AHSA1/START domain